MATNLDLVTLALRRLGVTAKDDAPNADDMALGLTSLVNLLAEITSHGVTAWTDDAISSDVAGPLEVLLACDLAQGYAVSPPSSRASAVLRVLAILNPDDRQPEPNNPVSVYF